MLCTKIVSDIQNNFCTQIVNLMFCKKESFWQRFTCNLGKKEKRKGKIKAQGKNSIPVQEAATSSSSGFDREDFEEEKEFYETVCHWVNCDKGDFGTQDNLVKVCILITFY